MCRVALLTLVPVVRDLDGGERERTPERVQPELIGYAPGEGRRQRRDAVGVGRYDRCRNDARQPQ
jgi:hypothetical protein